LAGAANVAGAGVAGGAAKVAGAALAAGAAKVAGAGIDERSWAATWRPSSANVARVRMRPSNVSPPPLSAGADPMLTRRPSPAAGALEAADIGSAAIAAAAIDGADDWAAASVADCAAAASVADCGCSDDGTPAVDGAPATAAGVSGSPAAMSGGAGEPAASGTGNAGNAGVGSAAVGIKRVDWAGSSFAR
jgi:hypothetical protein